MQYHVLTEEELCRLLIQGDSRAFGEFVERYGRPVRRIIRRLNPWFTDEGVADYGWSLLWALRTMLISEAASHPSEHCQLEGAVRHVAGRAAFQLWKEHHGGLS